jgi:hypothetical protein
MVAVLLCLGYGGRQVLVKLLIGEFYFLGISSFSSYVATQVTLSAPP